MADGVVLHKHPSDSAVEPAAHTDVVQHDSECYWQQQHARIKAIRTQTNVGQSLGVEGYNELFGYVGAYQNDHGDLVWQALLQLWQSYLYRNQMLQGGGEVWMGWFACRVPFSKAGALEALDPRGIASSITQPCSC